MKESAGAPAGKPAGKPAGLITADSLLQRSAPAFTASTTKDPPQKQQDAVMAKDEAAGKPARDKAAAQEAAELAKADKDEAAGAKILKDEAAGKPARDKAAAQEAAELAKADKEMKESAGAPAGKPAGKPAGLITADSLLQRSAPAFTASTPKDPPQPARDKAAAQE